MSRRYAPSICAVLLLCTVLACAEQSEPLQTATSPDLRVEQTAFVLRQADGRVLKGVQLQGMVLKLPVGGDIHALRLASITPDPDDAAILRHEFQIEDEAGRWQPVCEPNIDGETWGFPLALAAGHPGREGTITLTCASGAVAKCIRYGYQPWGQGRHGESLEPYHAACVHMIRADYAGDGTPHTRPGTYIQYHDDAVHWRRDTDGTDDPAYAFEAGWSPQGAVCVARVRWPEFGALDAIRRSSPRLAAITEAACTEDFARTRAALIFSSTRLQPRTGR